MTRKDSQNLKIYVDIETLGLCGPVKTIQYSIDRKKVEVIVITKNGLKTFGVVEHLKKFFAVLDDPNNIIVGYNLSYDLYHLYRLKHEMLGHDLRSFKRPIKAFQAVTLDLYTHALRVGPFASFAYGRRTKSVAKLRKIPIVMKEAVNKIVTEKLLPLLPPGVSLHHSEHRIPDQGKIPPEQRLITLSWSVTVSQKLKALAAYYGQETDKLSECWPTPDFEEDTHLPYYDRKKYAKLESEADKILRHDSPNSKMFFRYVENDIKFLWLLEDKFGSPRPDYQDANCEIVAYTRYYGFPLERSVLVRTRDEYKRRMLDAQKLLKGVNLKSPKERLERLQKYDKDLGSSNKNVLTRLAKMEEHPAHKVAIAMLDYNPSRQRYDQIVKLLQSETGRFHPDLKVMGTSTGRMAGTSGFNAQGISKEKDFDHKKRPIGIREAIKTKLGGDFAGFEVAIAASAWHDDKLLAELDKGIDTHTSVMCAVHPVMKQLKISFEQAVKIREDKKHPQYGIVNKCRGQIKPVVFGVLYGATAMRVASTLGISIIQGEEVVNGFFSHYSGLGAFKKKEEQRFLTADTKCWALDSVSKMARIATDLTGFVRRFDFEAMVADTLWRMSYGKALKDIDLPDGKIIRQEKKGPQTYHNCLRSALLGAAIAIQQAVFRAGVNMPIQGTGGNLTKKLSAKVWKTKHVPMLNAHDENIWVDHPDLDPVSVRADIKEFENENRKLVKHLRFDVKEMETWAEKD